MPALATDDVDVGRAAAVQDGFDAMIESYQKVIAREGVEMVVDLAGVDRVDVVRASWSVTAMRCATISC